MLLHWDAKQLPDVAGGRERVERLTIHVTGGDKEYLLEAAKIPKALGITWRDCPLVDAGLEASI